MDGWYIQVSDENNVLYNFRNSATLQHSRETQTSNIVPRPLAPVFCADNSLGTTAGISKRPPDLSAPATLLFPLPPPTTSSYAGGGNSPSASVLLFPVSFRASSLLLFSRREASLAVLAAVCSASHSYFLVSKMFEAKGRWWEKGRERTRAAFFAFFFSLLSWILSVPKPTAPSNSAAIPETGPRRRRAWQL